jgi:DNA sulfur modification protein DndD
MKLEKVELKNIRQFAGTQSLKFAVDSAHKVTLIHGPNAVGKTTLLNAIHWCLYGTFLAGFNEPDRLKSDQSEGDEYYVQVQFEHHGRRYAAKRSSTGAPAQAELAVLEQKKNGQSVPHPSPDLLINSILPQGLAHFFFFAGEMIQKGLAAGTYQKGATEAIRSVLGLRLAEQAIEDLKDVRKKRHRELQNLSAGTDLAKVTTDLPAAEEFVESRSQQLISQRELMSQLESKKRTLFDELREFEPSSKLQRRREENATRLVQSRRALHQASLARQDLIAEFGTHIFGAESAKEALEFIDVAVAQKRIPSPFDKTFVQDILKSQTCVCNRPVLPGTNEYKAIALLVNSATDETIIKRTLAVRAICDRVGSAVSRADKAFRRAFELYEAAEREVERLEQEEERVKDLLQRHESNNVRQLESQLDGVEAQLRSLVSNKQKTEDEIEGKKQQIVQLKSELERAQAATPAIDDARIALAIIDTLITNLDEELNRVEAQGIRRISESLNDLVSRSTRQVYSAEVSREYVVKLSKGDNGGARKPVFVLSSGERRLLDLCFVSALVAVCKERETEASTILLPGAVAPLVVDAPFGELDPEYQALAATTMKELSEQLILMLSKTHWTREVDEAIRPFLGAEYLLVGYKTGPARDAASVRTMIAGKTYDQLIFDAKRDWTEIRGIGGAN